MQKIILPSQSKVKDTAPRSGFATLSGGATAVRVGVIIDSSSQIGKEQIASIAIAAGDLRSYVLDGLSFNISDSGSNAENLIAEWGANAIITTVPWPEVVQIVKIGEKAKIPVLSLATIRPPTLAPKPYLFRLSHSEFVYVQCIADIIKLYGWRQVIVLYEDDDYNSASASVLPLLNDALQAIRTEIIRHVAFPPLDSLSDPNGLLHRQLKKLSMQLCKVFIVVRWSSPSQAINLFKEAHRLGMMEKGHVWVVGDDLTSLLDSTFTPSFVSSFLQGVIGVRTYFEDTNESYSNFSAKFQQRFNFAPGMHALQAYDAVQVITRAHALLDGIRMSRFIGMMGLVQFRSDGDLVEENGSMVFRVINVVGRSYRETGIWLKGTGFRETVGFLGTVWPGGVAGRVPGGWGKLRLGVPAKTVDDKFVKVERDRKGNVTEVTGFCIDVFMEARRRLNYELDYEFSPFDGTSYNDLVAAVPERFDGVVGDVTIVSKRLQNATFTEPFLSSGLMALVRVKPDDKRWVLTRPFTSQVWFVMAASYIYTCAVVWYLEQKANPEFQGPWNTQLGATLWLIFSTIFFAHGKLHSYYTKVVIGAWLFLLLILTSAFTASLGSILTSQNLKPVFSDRKVGCDGSSFAVEYLQEALGYKAEQIERVMSLEDYDAAFEGGNITKAYVETPYLRVFLAQYEGYTVHGDTKRLGGFGFVFPKGSPLAADFSKAILQLSEDGTLNHLEDKWFALSMDTCPATVKDRIRESLGLDSLWTLFLITGSVSTIVLIIFKARFLPTYSLKDVSVPLRERCVSLWKYKLSNQRVIRRSHRPSSSSNQIAPELCDTPIQGDILVDSLPNQNNA